MAEVIPAILENNFLEIEKKIRQVEKLVKWVQIDIADNTLVPNTTFLDPSPFKVLKTPVLFEVHMMVSDPLKYMKQYVDSGFKRVIAHIEANNIDEFLSKAEEMNVEVGLAIDGPTPLERIKKYLEDIDVVLVMAIEAGFSGKPYREETSERIRVLKDWLFDLPIAVDGAMNLENATKVVEAGALRINSNSYIFQASNISDAIESLRRLDPTIRSYTP